VAAAGPVEIFNQPIVLTIVTLLPIMNPFSTAPLFVSLTADYDEKRRNREARLACLYAFGLLVTFLLLGAAIIDFFRISVPGLRVAGGLIISMIGFKMLFPGLATASTASGEKDDPDIAFTPIAMPSLAGPGSISVVLTAAAQIRNLRPENWEVIYAGVIVGMLVTLVISFLVLRAAAAFVKVMGATGIDAMTRIFGFLLIAIGMQFLLTGISDFYGIAHR